MIISLGDIDVTITHIYDADHQWSIEYEAVASEDTLFSPTNHVYFNLNQIIMSLIIIAFQVIN